MVAGAKDEASEQRNRDLLAIINNAQCTMLKMLTSRDVVDNCHVLTELLYDP